MSMMTMRVPKNPAPATPEYAPEHLPEYFESVTVHRAGRRMAVTVLVGVLAMLGWTGGMIYTISGWISGH
jgi:hypothetical protein